MLADVYVGVHAREFARSHIHLSFADIVVAIEYLALQVRKVYTIAVDESDRADAGGSEVHHRRGPKTTEPDHRDASSLETLLSLVAKALQAQVPAVANEFIGPKSQGRTDR